MHSNRIKLFLRQTFNFVLFPLIHAILTETRNLDHLKLYTWIQGRLLIGVDSNGRYEEVAGFEKIVFRVSYILLSWTIKVAMLIYF